MAGAGDAAQRHGRAWRTFTPALFNDRATPHLVLGAADAAAPLVFIPLACWQMTSRTVTPPSRRRHPCAAGVTSVVCVLRSGVNRAGSGRGERR